MDIKKFAEKGLKNMKWYDISIIKLSVMLSTLFFLTLFPSLANFLLQFEWYWYLILMVLVSSCTMKRFFKKNPLF